MKIKGEDNAMYLHDWKNSGINGLIDDFQINEADLDGVEILLASYTYEDYSGDAFVLYRKDGRYYEVNGGHCSCMGLEGQWEPEEVNLEEMWHRLINGNLGQNWGENEFSSEIKSLLASLLGKTDV